MDGACCCFFFTSTQTGLLGNAHLQFGDQYGQSQALLHRRSYLTRSLQQQHPTWAFLATQKQMLDVCRITSEKYPQQTINAVLNEDLQQLDRNGIVSLLQQGISLPEGKRIHAHIVALGLFPDTFLGNLIIAMYRRCKAMEDVRSVFHTTLYQHNIISWNIMIGAYSEHDCSREAFELFNYMQQHGVEPDRITFVSVLSVCVSRSALAQGRAVHLRILNCGLQSNVFIATALLNMYSKCGALEDARAVFDEMYVHDLVSWNAIISAYSQHGSRQEAVHLFWQMQGHGMQPNKVTFISLLGVFTSPAALVECKLIHASIIDAGFESDAVVGTALIDMYGKCDALQHAQIVFDKLHPHDVVPWNVMISAYSQHGHSETARQLFQKMQCQGIRPNEATFIGVLNACASPAALMEGMMIHASIVGEGLNSVMIGTALVQMYGKCEALTAARVVFDKMQKQDVISWTAMIASYSQYGHTKVAFQLFQQMQQNGAKPDSVTLVSMLCACACPEALIEGRAIHLSIIDHGMESDGVVKNALVNMYGKCGGVEDARWVFDKIQRRDIVSWNAMMTAYSKDGCGEETLQMFQEMLQTGIEPDEVTYTCLLSSCSHAGLVEEGSRFFVAMREDHNITPTLAHYSCMVDLLGRSGQLDEAENIIRKMPIQPDTVIWTAILSACKTHRDVERAKWATEHIFALEKEHAAALVLISDVYAADERCGA